MTFRKIYGPTRIDAGVNGADQEYALEARPGGRMVKSVMYMIRVIQKANANVKLGIKIKHGPDGQAFTNHTSTASATVNADDLMVFDGAAGTVGEWIRPVVVAGGTATGDWMQVEVYEMRKPF